MGKKYIMREMLAPYYDKYTLQEKVVELEEIQEEKKETLEEKLDCILDKIYCRQYPHGQAEFKENKRKLAEIARTYFQSHPEELGLVRIDDVLDVLDRSVNEFFTYYSSQNGLKNIRKSIEGMKGSGK